VEVEEILKSQEAEATVLLREQETLVERTRGAEAFLLREQERARERSS
jgi:hypothetical protein